MSLTPLQLVNVDPLFIGIVAVYFAVVLGIGYYGYKTTKTEEDFLVAGRNVGPLVGGATLSATQMSAGTLVGTFGLHYLLGFGFVWIWPGLWAGWIVSLVLVAPQMRRFGSGDRSRLRRRTIRRRRRQRRLLPRHWRRAHRAGLHRLPQRTVHRWRTGVPDHLGCRARNRHVRHGDDRGRLHLYRRDACEHPDRFRAGSRDGGGGAGSHPAVAPLHRGYWDDQLHLPVVQPSFVGQALSTADIVGFMAAFGFSIAAAPYEITRIYSMKDEKTVRQAIGITLIFQAIIGTSVAVLGVTMRVLFPNLSTPDLASVVMSLNVLGPILGALSSRPCSRPSSRPSTPS